MVIMRDRTVAVPPPPHRVIGPSLPGSALSPPPTISRREMSAPKATISHVIFDMDGLLLDTEKFYTVVQERILARFGKTFDWSLKAKMMGKKAIESARIFVEEFGLDGLLTPEGFLDEREEMLQELFPTAELMPGAKRLIYHLHRSGVPMSIATGSHRRHFDLKTKNHEEIFSMMQHVVLGDDPEVKHGKPSPDVYLAAARRFKIAPQGLDKVLVFEDAPAGVTAAKNAGMHAVMVPDARLDSSYHAAADLVLSTLEDFNPSDWDLPPFENELESEHNDAVTAAKQQAGTGKW